MRTRRPSTLLSLTVLLPLAACVPGDASDSGDAAGDAGTTTEGPDSASAGSATQPTSSDSSPPGTGGTDGPTAGGTTDEPTGGETGNDTGNDTGDEAGNETGDETGSDSSSGGEPPSNDPFDPAACNGVAWTGADAMAQLGGMERVVLDDAIILARTRTCPGGVCGDWSEGTDWEIHYLTWSGGVTTRYMDLLADMNLVLFDDAGAPRLSIQHDTFGVGGYPDEDGMLYGFPPEPISYPHLRAFNQFPRYMYDYIDLDYQVSDGVLVLGDGCAVWTADPYGQSEPYTTQYGLLFRW